MRTPLGWQTEGDFHAWFKYEYVPPFLFCFSFFLPDLAFSVSGAIDASSRPALFYRLTLIHSDVPQCYYPLYLPARVWIQVCSRPHVFAVRGLLPVSAVIVLRNPSRYRLPDLKCPGYICHIYRECEGAGSRPLNFFPFVSIFESFPSRSSQIRRC